MQTGKGTYQGHGVIEENSSLSTPIPGVCLSHPSVLYPSQKLTRGGRTKAFLSSMASRIFPKEGGKKTLLDFGS